MCMHASQLVVFPSTCTPFVCTYTDTIAIGVCGNKACSRLCMERYISMCMNVYVIVHACSCALLSMQLLSAACMLAGICCHMASGQEHTRQCRGK